MNNTQDDIITVPTLTQTELSNNITFPAFIIIKARAKLVIFCGRHWWKPKKWKEKIQEIPSSQPIRITGFYIIWKITSLWILYFQDSPVSQTLSSLRHTSALKKVRKQTWYKTIKSKT